MNKTLTWQPIYKAVAGSTSSLKSSHVDLLSKIASGLTSFARVPWVCLGSSNAVAGSLDRVNRLSDESDYTWAAAASPHSWIVLKEPRSGAQVCFDCSPLYNLAQGPKIKVVVSRVGGFTGGDASNRPTASDEIVTETRWLGTAESDPQFRGRLFIWRDTLGYCTRIVFLNNGVPVLFWMFDTMQSPTSTPTFVHYVSSAYTDFTTNKLTIDEFFDNKRVLSQSGSTTLTCHLSTKMFNGEPILNSIVKNPHDNSYLIDSPSVYCVGALTNYGKIGSLYDFYFGSASIPVGTMYPNNSLDWVQIGQLIFPWDGEIFRAK
jgi:hypothetical protein